MREQPAREISTTVAVRRPPRCRTHAVRPGLSHPGGKIAVRHQTILAMSALMLLALVLRVMLAQRSGIWCDEAQFLWIVRMPSTWGMIEFLRHHESHPPLFYLVMRAWLALFGDSEPAALALPVALGVAIVPVAYLVGAGAFSRRVGLIAACLVASSPMLGLHSALVRPYSLLPLLCLVSVSCLWSSLNGAGIGRRMGYVAATLAMLLTHNWSFMVLGAQWIIVGTWIATRGRRSASALIRGWLAIQSVLLIGYAAWVPTFLHQSRHAGYGPGMISLPSAIREFAEVMLSMPVSLDIALCLVLIVAGIRRVRTRATTGMPAEDGDKLALILFAAVPILSFLIAATLSFKSYLVLQRCMTTVAPCVLLTVAYGLARLSTMPKVFTFLLFSLYVIIANQIRFEVKSNAREVASMVSARARPSDLVVVSPAWFSSSFNYYFDASNPEINYPFEGRVGAICYDDMMARLLDPGAMAAVRSRLEAAHREGRRVWLVTEVNHLSDNVPDGDVLAETPGLETYPAVGYTRSNQLRKLIGRAYGAPSARLATGGRGGTEVLCAFLYDPTVQDRVPRHNNIK